MINDVLKRAESGDAEAQNTLGFLYMNSKNPNKSIKWYRKSAKNGSLHGQFSLGECYYNGIGVKQDYVEALKWLEKSGEQGHHLAQHLAGKCCYKFFENTHEEPYLEKSLEWHEKAACLEINNLDYQVACYLAYTGAFLHSSNPDEMAVRGYARKALDWSEVIEDRIDVEQTSFIAQTLDVLYGVAEV